MTIDLLTTPEALRPLLDEVVDVYREGFGCDRSKAERFRGVEVWADRMRDRVPAELYAEWFEGHFEVVEFAVRPARYLRKGWRRLADVDDAAMLMGIQLRKAKPA